MSALGGFPLKPGRDNRHGRYARARLDAAAIASMKRENTHCMMTVLTPALVVKDRPIAPLAEFEASELGPRLIAEGGRMIAQGRAA